MSIFAVQKQSESAATAIIALERHQSDQLDISFYHVTKVDQLLEPQHATFLALFISSGKLVVVIGDDVEIDENKKIGNDDAVLVDESADDNF